MLSPTSRARPSASSDHSHSPLMHLVYKAFPASQAESLASFRATIDLWYFPPGQGTPQPSVAANGPICELHAASFGSAPQGSRQSLAHSRCLLKLDEMMQEKLEEVRVKGKHPQLSCRFLCPLHSENKAYI